MTAMTWDALADPAAKRSDARLPRRPVTEATKGRNVQLAVTSGEELSDSECVTRAVDGDARAFEHLYRRHVGRVLGLCLRLVDGDRAKAEQHVQDAFVRAWEKMPGFRGAAQFSPWLHRLTVNLTSAERRVGKKGF